MTNVSVYEQDCWGRKQWRVQRDDGCLVFNCHQLDFETEDDALTSIEGEFRRNKLGPVKVRVQYGHREYLPDHVKPDDRIVVYGE